MSKKIYIQHNKICFACGIERHKKELGYEINTLKTYCTDKNRCPNGNEIPDVELVELNTDSLRHAINENFEADVVKSLDSMLGKTIGARISPALGMHLLKFAEAEGIYSVNATVIHILEEHFANNEVTDDLEGSNFTHKAEPKAKTVSEELVQKMAADKIKEELESPLLLKVEDPEKVKEVQEALAESDTIKIKVNDKPLTPEDLGEEKGLGEEEEDEFSF
jgi:hypothetical protein